MKPLRAGVIGLGVGEQHIAGFGRHPSCEVVALCDLDPAKRSMAEARYPGVSIFESAEALLDQPEIDVVSICSYDDDHHEQIVQAIRAGKHVFAEKPLCTSREEMEDIRETLAANPQVRMSSNLILRHSPRFRRLREAVAEGGFGTLFHVEGDYNYGRLQKLTQGWRGRIPGYSVVLGGGLHMVDLLLWISGDRVAEVAAFGNGLSSRGSSYPGDDMVVAILHFESGMVGKVAANFGCVEPHFHRLMLYGTKATFENGRDAGRVYRSREPGAPPELMTDSYPGTEKGDLIPSFLNKLLGLGEALVSEAEVFAAMSVCFAIDRARAERRAVDVPAV